MLTSIRSLPRLALLVLLSIAAAAAASSSFAQIPYNNPGPFVLPVAAPGLPSPAQVPGKQYSHYQDQNAAGAADPAQIISWDGFGGTTDDGDYSAPAPPFAPNGNFQIDALANERDSLFNAVRTDTAHLVYSVDHRAFTTPAFGQLPFTIPSAGPLNVFDTIKGGFNVIGGAGEISYELGTFAGTLPNNKHGVWATQAQINGSAAPVDVDALELWGAEPSAGAPSDAGKYSADSDASTAGANFAYSVWTYAQTGHTGYVPQSMVVDLVRNLLQTTGLNAQNVDLDALMVMDDHGSPNSFDPGDHIIFSIRQVPTAAAPGFLATGSEIFVLDGASTAAAPVGSFLFHGGHLWDKTYAETNMVAHFQGIDTPSVDVQLDLSALEAVAGVPEPATFLLASFAVLALAGRARRKRSAI